MERDLPLDAIAGEIHRGPDGRWYRLEWALIPGQLAPPRPLLHALRRPANSG